MSLGFWIIASNKLVSTYISKDRSEWLVLCVCPWVLTIVT
jgi:hypothetical protein